MEKQIVCVGNMTHDILLRVEDLPKIDDVGYVYDNTKCMGGRGAIVALTLSSLGCNCSYFTSIPNNPNAKKYLEFLQNNGVNIDGIYYDDICEEMYEVFVAITKKEENCISFFKPANLEFRITQKQKQICDESDIFYFSTHQKKYNLELLSMIDEKNKTIIHNVSSYFINSESYLNVMIQKSNILIGNEEEINALKNKLRIDDLRLLFRINPNLSAIFVTYGKIGSKIFYNNGYIEMVAADEALATSPVGAGDSYSAGIVYGMSQNWSYSDCAKFASELAAISVESHTSYPDIEKVKELKEKNKERRTK